MYDKIMILYCLETSYHSATLQGYFTSLMNKRQCRLLAYQTNVTVQYFLNCNFYFLAREDGSQQEKSFQCGGAVAVVCQFSFKLHLKYRL